MFNIKNLQVTLSEELSKDRNVIIIPHLGIDFDAIGSAIGISVLATKYKKASFIVVDDQPHKIDPGVKVIIDESKDLGINYINKSRYLQKANKNELIILTDVNKTPLICLESEEIKGKDTIIIDHHNEDKNTIQTEMKFIDEKRSSASEIITELLCATRTKYREEIANYLLTGIYLDTNRLTKNVSSNTMLVASKLLEHGASLDKVNEFFTEDFFSDRKVQKLVSTSRLLTYSIATVVGELEDEYTKEELAKASDYLLKYKVDASFAIGMIEKNVLSISARSKGKINVGEIMQQLGGGGNLYSAATKQTNTTPEDAHKELQKIIRPAFYKNPTDKFI